MKEGEERGREGRDKCTHLKVDKTVFRRALNPLKKAALLQYSLV